MQIIVGGELLDGFHIEEVPVRVNIDDRFDRHALSARAGMRAVWLLYQRERWEHLEDFGVRRADIEPVLSRLAYGPVLTERQVQQLMRIPELVAVSRELRLAYALKFYTQTEERYDKTAGKQVRQAPRKLQDLSRGVA